MRPQDNFNIITGQIKKQLPLNSTSKRFQSLDLIKNQTLSGAYHYPLPQSKPLGKPKDHKLFLYTYTGNDPINTVYKTKLQEQSSPNLLNHTNNSENINQSLNMKTLSHPRSSLINATKLDYNIVNNTYHPNNQPTNWTQTKRKFPISKFVHDGRTYAPNYTEGYQKKQSDRQFARKTNLCGNICQIQKNYGTGKFFRKFK